MFQLKNYTFLGDYSILNYKDSKSIHLFIKKGGLIPKFLFGKKGVVLVKNEARYNKIIYYKLSFLNVSKSKINLNPDNLKNKKNIAKDILFENSLGDKEKNLTIKKIELSRIRLNFKLLNLKTNSKIKCALIKNFSNKIQKYLLLHKPIKIES